VKGKATPISGSPGSGQARTAASRIRYMQWQFICIFK